MMHVTEPMKDVGFMAYLDDYHKLEGNGILLLLYPVEEHVNDSELQDN